MSTKEAVLSIKRLIEKHRAEYDAQAKAGYDKSNWIAFEAYIERGIALHDLMTDMERLPCFKQASK